MKPKSHHIYLFSLKNGKRRLAYGEDPQDALRILARRLTQQEMEEITEGEPLVIPQRDLQKWVSQLG